MVSPKEHGLLGEEGIELQGSELTLDEAVALARKRYKWMPLCAVEEWIILDAIVTDDERAKSSRRRLPTNFYVCPQSCGG